MLKWAKYLQKRMHDGIIFIILKFLLNSHVKIKYVLLIALVLCSFQSLLLEGVICYNCSIILFAAQYA